LRATAILCCGAALLAGCALKGDVRRVELQVASLKDSLRAAQAARKTESDSVLAAIAGLRQALAAEHAYMVQTRGDVRTDMLSVQQQLVTIQELMGQSQQRLTELRTRLEAQARQPIPGADTAGAGAGGAGAAGVAAGAAGGGAGASTSAGPKPDQVYDASMQQYRRGAFATARAGFREFLRLFPNEDRASDAMFYIGETFASDSPDSAAAVYQQLIKTYPTSPRAPSALYKLGLQAESRGERATARTYYQRIVSGYPRSDEANLARDRLQRLGK